MENLVATILVAALAASPGVYAIWRQRKKLDAETTKTDAEAVEIWQRLAKEAGLDLVGLRNRIVYLEGQVLELQNERDELRRLIAELRELIRDLRARIRELETVNATLSAQLEALRNKETKP